MKKIFLLFSIVAFVLTASAQYSAKGNEIVQVKNAQSSSLGTDDGFIENITVYPNPVFDILKVSFKSSHSSLAVISLYNNIGKPVYTQQFEVDPGNNVISIDIRSKSIESGVYFIQCVAEKEVYTRKLIVK